MDTSATRSVVGKLQAIAYHKLLGMPFKLKKGPLKYFKFGNTHAKSLGRARFLIPLETGKYIDATLDVVDLGVPLFIGLDRLDIHKLYVDNVDNMLVCKDPAWSGKLKRKNGNLYYVWEFSVMNSDSDLR